MNNFHPIIFIPEGDINKGKIIQLDNRYVYTKEELQKLLEDYEIYSEDISARAYLRLKKIQ